MTSAVGYTRKHFHSFSLKINEKLEWGKIPMFRNSGPGIVIVEHNSNNWEVEARG